VTDFSRGSRLEIYLRQSAGEKLLARRREDLIGKDFWMEFPEFTRGAFEEHYRRAMSEQVAVEFEASDESGQVWFEVLAYPSGGGVSFFLRDVYRSQAR